MPTALVAGPGALGDLIDQLKLRFLRNLETALHVFSLVDGRAPRGIAITRKNFLFLGSEAGGERAAILYTVLESAKLNGLDPEAYLADVIDRLARGHPINRLAELLPWKWHRPAAKL